MYLHLGQDTVIKTDEILGIFDLDNTSVSKWTREYLNLSEREKRVVYVSFDLPKSFILTKDKKVYISPLSPSTLIKRIEQLEKIKE